MFLCNCPFLLCNILYFNSTIVKLFFHYYLPIIIKILVLYIKLLLQLNIQRISPLRISILTRDILLKYITDFHKKSFMLIY
jgi:hypothetical protein